MIEPIAAFDRSDSYTNLSRSFSLSILDQNGTEIGIQTNPIEFFIPRDPNVVVPLMYFQNATLNNEKKSLFLYYHIKFPPKNLNLTFSVHFEMKPVDLGLSYLIIYKFDLTPQFTSSIKLIDGWTIFSPSSKVIHFEIFTFNRLNISDLTSDGMFIHFIDNHQTSNHHSIIYGIRQINSNETFNSNSPIIDEYWNFSSDYQLRTYLSGCFYLDANNNWQSDGLTVTSLLLIMWLNYLFGLGWTNDKSFSNSMFFNTFDNIH